MFKYLIVLILSTFVLNLSTACEPIAGKCDTIWKVPSSCYVCDRPVGAKGCYLLIGCDGIHAPVIDLIVCDTIWDDKVNLWLTPEQYKMLIEILGDSERKQRYEKAAKKTAKETNDEWIRMAKQDLKDLKEMEILYKKVRDKLK